MVIGQLLSPRNKAAGPPNDDYRRKLGDYEAGGSNWVEVDLLRSSRRHLPVTWDDLPPDRRRDYLVLTYRSAADRVSAYPIGIRDRLPTIAVPLRPADADVPLNLQAVFDRVYDDGPFEADADYARPPDPPLAAADAAWAAELLAGHR